MALLPRSRSRWLRVRRVRVPDWVYPVGGVGEGGRGLARGLLRIVVYAGGTVLLVQLLGFWGLLLTPVLIGIVLAVEFLAQLGSRPE